MGWVVNATPWPFTPGKDTRYPLYKRMGGPQGRSGQVRKISPPTGIRSPDRPALSESLYRLRYPGPHQNPVYVCLLPMHATCTTHTTFLDFITLIIPADESKLRSSSLCNFLSPPVPPSLPTGSKNFPQDPLFKYPQSRLFPERSRSNLISIQNNLTPATGRQHRGRIIPQAVTHSLVLLKMGRIISRNLLSWLELLISRYCCI